MTYDPANDLLYGTSASAMTPAAACTLVVPSDTQDITPYPKALRIYVPSSITEAAVKITPKRAALDTDTVTLKFAPGVYDVPLGARRVWASGTTAGIEIHGYLV